MEALLTDITSLKTFFQFRWAVLSHRGLPYSSNDGSSNACKAQKSLFNESKSELKA